jgi:hypothetical protein
MAVPVLYYMTTRHEHTAGAALASPIEVPS